MKKGKHLEQMSNSLFGRLESNRLDGLAARMIKGGEDTTTTLCKTSAVYGDDKDSQASQENFQDARCKGTLELANS